MTQEASQTTIRTQALLLARDSPVSFLSQAGGPSAGPGAVGTGDAAPGRSGAASGSESTGDTENAREANYRRAQERRYNDPADRHESQGSRGQGAPGTARETLGSAGNAGGAAGPTSDELSRISIGAPRIGWPGRRRRMPHMRKCKAAARASGSPTMACVAMQKSYVMPTIFKPGPGGGDALTTSLRRGP